MFVSMVILSPIKLTMVIGHHGVSLSRYLAPGVVTATVIECLHILDTTWCHLFDSHSKPTRYMMLSLLF